MPFRPSGVATAAPLLALDDVAVIVQDQSQVTTLTPLGGGYTEFLLDSANSGTNEDPHLRNAYLIPIKDTDGLAMTGRHDLYDIALGLVATADDGGVLPEGVEVDLLLLNTQANTVLDAADDAFGIGAQGLAGGEMGPLAVYYRSSWQRDVPATGTGDTGARVVWGGVNQGASATGSGGYAGCWAASGADFPPSPLLRMADGHLEVAGVAADTYTHAVLCVGWYSVQGADVTIRVKPIVRAVRRGSSAHGMGAQGFRM